VADNICGFSASYNEKIKGLSKYIHSIHPQIQPAQNLIREMRDNGKERGKSEGTESAGQITGR
jgi:hypothetical protein